MKNLLSKFLAVILALTFFGCAAYEKFQANPWVKKAELIGLNALATYGSGGTVNAAWAIAQGMYAISGQIKNKPDQDAAKDIETAAIEWAGPVHDVNIHKLARDLSKAYLAAQPASPVQRKDAVVELGLKLQAAAAKGQRHD